ncbi:MAG: M16 family metallopeptidase [Myxococcota bacterium]
MTSLLIATLLTATTAAPVTPAEEATDSRLPPVERLTLDNGLTVLLMENHANPFFEIRYAARAGSALDPEGEEGLASLTAAMLTNGTPDMDEEQVAQALARMGARLNASADVKTFEVSGSLPTLEPEHLARFLDLFRDVLREATFPEDSLAKTKKLRLSAIRRMLDQHGHLADVAIDAALYGDGPRGRMKSGYLGTVPGLTRADLVAFRDRVVIPQHAVLGIAGDFDAQAMKTWLEEHLGDASWGEGACTPGEIEGRCAKLCDGDDCLVNPFAGDYSDDRPPKAEGRERTVLLVDRDDSSINQIQWRLGQDNPVTLLERKWPAFRLGTQILGGDFTARLNTVLRVKEGLTYGARFHVDYGAHDSGPMYVSTFVSPGDVGRAIDLSLEQLRAVTERPLPPREVASFKGKIINAFPFKFETVSDALAQYLYLEVGGVDVAWLERYTDELARPTPEDVQQAMQVLDPGRMVLVAVGNRDLLPTLGEFGRVKVVKATDLLDSGLRKATWAEQTP